MVGVSKSQVHRIIARSDELVTFSNKKTFQPDAKRMKNEGRHPELDQTVFDWFDEIRNGRDPMSLSRAHIQARAQREARLRNILDFKASDGWFRNWRKRFGVGVSMKLHGEAGDVRVAEIGPVNEFRSKLEHFHPKNILNMDESGLYYRALPTRSYISPAEGDRSTVRGTKTLKGKDRLTVAVCVNAPGICKVPPFLIGSSKNPHCFRDGQPPVPYCSQKISWMDRPTYNHGFNEVFLPTVRKWTEDPVALIMDNCSGHDMECQDPEGQVSIFLLPPNVTSVYQPLVSFSDSVAGECLVGLWINVETDPEAIANEEVERVENIQNQFDSSALDSSLDASSIMGSSTFSDVDFTETCSSTPVPCVIEHTSDEKKLKDSLLNSASAVLEVKLNTLSCFI